MQSDTPGRRMTRRDFVRRSAATAVLGGMLAAPSIPAAAQEVAPPGGIPRRRIPKLDTDVSVVCFGSFGLTNPAVLEAALDAGVNLIDTGPGYSEGNAERVIGQVMEKRRDEAILTTKFEKVVDGITKDELLQQLDGSLQRLRTDHVDIMQIPMADSAKVFQVPALYEAFAEAKEAGKVRHLGFSAHDANLGDCITEAIEHDEMAGMVIRYNVMQPPDLDDRLQKAAEAKLAAIVMKVSAGNRDKELQEFAREGDLQTAAVRWALSNPSITSVCCGMLSFADVEKFTQAVQQPVSQADLDLLRRYRVAVDHVYCRNCGTCQRSCPHGVMVKEITRYAMYYRYYGFEREAMRLYAALKPSARAAACTACSGHCAGACPHGLDTPRIMAEAHRMLS